MSIGCAVVTTTEYWVCDCANYVLIIAIIACLNDVDKKVEI